MKNYREFIITSKPFVPEVLQGILWQLDISGIQEEETDIKVFCEVDKQLNEDIICSLLENLIFEKIIESFQVSESIIENKNWDDEWAKSRNIIHVTERLVIKPSFKIYDPKPNQIVITIDPKMSFGTGEHQSTKLALYFIEKYLNAGDIVLDIGTGTAVLAIASAKFGASKVTAIDNDEWSFYNAVENCKINDVDNKIEIKFCETADVGERNFDIILANIQRDILIQIKDEIKQRTKKGGLVILSGLLKQDEKEICEEYKKLNFLLADRKEMDEWVSLALRYS